jgi:hypothetical protein
MEVKEKENLEGLTREELLELVKQLKKEVSYWKHRFNCVDREYDIVCWQYRIPRY